MKKYLAAIALALGIGLVAFVLLAPPKEPTVSFGGLTPTHFAEIDENGLVLRVIVADQAFIQSGKVGDPNNWIATDPETKARKNYAGVGYKYDKKRDAFIPPKHADDAIFDEEKARWISPPKPPKQMTASTTEL